MNYGDCEEKTLDEILVEGSTELQRTLYKKAARLVCEQEIEIYASRRYRQTTKLQRYFNSTPLKNVIGRVLVLNSYDNSFSTITEMADKLGVTRQIVSQIIKDCLQEGWVVRNKGGYMAGNQLVAALELYAKFRADMPATQEARDVYATIRELQKLQDNVK
tara:strand:- start:92 stop:574 length:483 start_codon:yes stop_codon:yes gene_type:complete